MATQSDPNRGALKPRIRGREKIHEVAAIDATAEGRICGTDLSWLLDRSQGPVKINFQSTRVQRLEQRLVELAAWTRLGLVGLGTGERKTATGRCDQRDGTTPNGQESGMNRGEGKEKPAVNQQMQEKLQ